MRQWSSTIGIITALAGNVLISVALNIQRYAHLRIAREWEQDKVKKEANWRRSQSDTRSETQYGAVGGERSHDDNQPGKPRKEQRHAPHRIFEEYRDDVDDPPRGRRGPSESPESMRNSFTSDRTARPGDKDDEFGDRKSYLQSPYWWAGIILMCLGETGNFMAYGFAPASIVSPLGVVALISNCVIAPCLLKERFRQRDFWGVLIAIAGAVVVVLSAKSSEEKIGPDEIWAMITTWEFETYLGLTCGLIVAFMWASFRYGSRSILIDVGLVALFGESPVAVLVFMRLRDILTRWDRRIYSSLHQGCFLPSVIYIMARHHLSYHLSAGLCSRLQRSDADPLYQSGPPAIRLYASDSNTICPLHTLCHYWKCSSIS